MKSIGAAMALLLASGAALAGAAAEPAKLWETPGFKTPESVLPVPAEGFAYVSNVAGQPTDKDGNGFISKLSLADGKIIALEWAKGLDAPKGMAPSGGKLYTADIDKLVEIDPASGKILVKFEAPGATFLNDVVADKDGNVYVSDSSTSTIWRLAGGKLEKWLEGPELKFPNGLTIDGDKLIVAAWGAPGTSAPKSEPANLISVGLADKKVSNLGDGAPVGNLDGIEADGDDFIVSDWVAGKVFRIARSGKADEILALKQGTADIGYVASDKLLLIPLMMEDKVAAYKVE
ncbi:SMP-30/Gluconolactonase/LRE-like region domain-containing protein [Hyphomicrobium sp. 1Nfss2.1]|uniref:SMP-30/gluconolactonase/LRE family protein n=1 Tax=Hyphomicrobium sp. 1Nfss2.1 TaxID=3413936 RepID=UPI003C7B8AFF